MRISRILISALLLEWLLLGCSKAAGSNVSSMSCQSRDFRGYAVSICTTDLPADPASPTDVLYYFHGIEESARNWEQAGLRTAIYDRYSDHPPVVFSVSFGPRWFLSDVARPLTLKPSRLAVFNEDIQPTLEREAKLHVRHRWVAGQSMGGFSALRLAIDQPQLYSAVVALCPAVMAIGPYSSPVDMAAYLKRNPAADIKILLPVSAFAVWEFPTPELWSRNNMITLASQPGFAMPKVFLSSNSADHYGFNDGTSLFADLLKNDGVPFEYQKLNGPHCHSTPEMLANAAASL